MSVIHMNLGTNSYDIVIRRGVLEEASKELNLDRKVIVISDDGVPKEYIDKVVAQCRDGHSFIFRSGEKYKNLQTVEAALTDMLEHGFTRKDCVVAVGGGVPGDLAGFTASAYMRGIDFYNIPTTALSQIDSSIGGKTGVNLAGVKNPVGAFYQPKKVLVDTDVFRTLPKRQISNGLAEALKMAACFDAELFNLFLEEEPFERLDEIIEKSLMCKKKVVEEDEKEAGLRKVLNFGHTLGHGIEGTLIDGQALYHGECVGLGMIPMCGEDFRPKMVECLKKLNLPVEYAFDEENVCQNLSHDKKSSGASISTVYCPEAGKFELRNRTVEELRTLLPLINSAE